MTTVIIGGVAAGMSAAARLRRLDEQAEIIVLERGKHVSFANCGLPYHIGQVIPERAHLLLQTPQSLAESLNIDVRTEHEVLAIQAEQKTVTVLRLADQQQQVLAFDTLVIATGAAPIKPAWPGVDLPHICSLRTLEDMAHIQSLLTQGTQHVTVIGGGFIGIEMTENLLHLGKQVMLLERGDQLMAPLDKEMAKDLERTLVAHGASIHTGCEVTGFEDRQGSLHVLRASGAAMPTDLVILAIGVQPEVKLAQGTPIAIGKRGGIVVNAQMQTTVKDIYAAGDAVEVVDTITEAQALVPLAGPANRQGRVIADNIAGIRSRYASTLGTSIVKVFDMVGATTGANEKRLRQHGIPYQKVYLHPAGHAGYYPGTRMMHLKLLFRPRTGEVLGAQAVGYDGVDKRIDVLATAIQAGLTVFDLETLELAYAPPFGSAKDPVNMAGFVASNLLDERVAFWYAEQWTQLPEKRLVIDVRGPAEFEKSHLPGAVNIPLAELRQRWQALPKDRPIYLYCFVGMRSYLAYRLLSQQGFHALQTLAGGYKTYLNTL